MSHFSVSRDHLSVLRMHRTSTPRLSLEQQETLELSLSSFGFLLARNESIGAGQFLSRIREHYQSGDPRQKAIEQVLDIYVQLDGEGQGTSHIRSTQGSGQLAAAL